MENTFINRTFFPTKLAEHQERVANREAREKELQAKAKKVKELQAKAKKIKELQAKAKKIKEAEDKFKVEEDSYYCGVYTSPDGSVTGEWYESMEGLDAESDKFLKSKYRRERYQIVKLPKDFVNDIAKEHKISVGEALSMCPIPS